MQASPKDTDSALRRAKRPRSVLAGPYGHPFHALLITIPIGSWTASVVFDIVAAFQDDPEPLRDGAALLIVVGLIGAVVAGIAGLLDLSTLAPGTRARKIALTHMSLNIAAILLFAASLAVRLSNESADPGFAGILFTVLAVLALGASGFLGGELAYRYGVRVADEDTQRAGFGG